MKSIKEIYRIGNGPSSSHTMGPRRAAEIFSEKNPDAARYEVTLYGSLAATGRGHLTDRAILEVLEPLAKTDIVWHPDVVLPFHTNGMDFKAFDKDGGEMASWRAYSVGGGALSDGTSSGGEWQQADIYPLTHMTDIIHWCSRTGKSYWEYVDEYEDSDVWDYLAEVWKTMCQAVRNGLDNEGVLPGPLHLRRKAASYYFRSTGTKPSLQSRGLVFAYALAVSEENAALPLPEIVSLSVPEDSISRVPAEARTELRSVTRSTFTPFAVVPVKPSRFVSLIVPASAPT